MVPPLNNGLPKIGKYACKDPKTVKEWIDNEEKSDYVYIVLATPMKKNAAPFLLMLFGTDNRFSCEDILARWSQTEKLLQDQGITVCGFSSDGDPRLLKSMKIKTELFEERKRKSMAKIPKHWSEWYRANISETPCVQDCLHITNKLKNRLMRTKPNYPPSDIIIGKLNKLL